MHVIWVVIGLDDRTGEYGLFYRDLPKISGPSVDISGIGLAHDYVEHVNGIKNIGTFEDELEALGGIWLCRGQTGILGNGFYSPEESLAHDVTRMFDIWSGQRQLSYVRSRYADFDYVFDEIEHHVRKDILEEYGEVEPHHIDEFLTCARYCFRSGTLKHQRRWDRRKGNDFNTYQNINETVAKNLPFDMECQVGREIPLRIYEDYAYLDTEYYEEF